MLTIFLSTEDLTRIRFRFNPLFELSCSLRAHMEARPDDLFGSWAMRARAGLRRRELSALESLHCESSYLPDFMHMWSHPPAPLRCIADVARAPREVVDLDLRHAYHGNVPQAYQGLGRSHRERVATLSGQMLDYWQGALADVWPRVLGVLESDLLQRAHQLALEGPEAVLSTLHPAIQYSDGVLQVDQPEGGVIDAGGRGLVLCPSLFAWPGVRACTNPRYLPFVTYSARGAGAFAFPRRPAALANASRDLLLQRGRVRVLEALEHEATTHSLAMSLDLSASAVSQQLGALAEAGLVESTRVGRFVHYRLTQHGRDVLSALESAGLGNRAVS